MCSFSQSIMGCCQSQASWEFQEFVAGCSRQGEFTMGALWHASDLYEAIVVPGWHDRLAWRAFYRRCHPGLTSSLQARLAAAEMA